MREKIVDFDFSHHKSSENISSLLESHAHHLHPTKSCFKHQQTQVSACTAMPPAGKGSPNMLCPPSMADVASAGTANASELRAWRRRSGMSCEAAHAVFPT